MKTICLVLVPLFILLPPNYSLGINNQFRFGPVDKTQETFESWWYQLQSDIAESNISLSVYDEESLSWARTSFIQPQLMLHDRFIYDRSTDKWTVDKYLNDLKERYGGIDSVLLWQGYPNIGIDDRNQFDMLDSLPGGIDGLRELVNELESHGVHVLLPYLPWDQGTRNSGQSDVISMIDVIKRSNCSGMNGDTLNGVNESFWQESLLQDFPIAIEPEVMYSNYQYLDTNVMSWSYWTSNLPIVNPIVPPISNYKAYTKGLYFLVIASHFFPFIISILLLRKTSGPYL